MSVSLYVSLCVCYSPVHGGGAGCERRCPVRAGVHPGLGLYRGHLPLQRLRLPRKQPFTFIHTHTHTGASLSYMGVRLIERLKEGGALGLIRLSGLLMPSSPLRASLSVRVVVCRWRARRVGVAVWGCRTTITSRPSSRGASPMTWPTSQECPPTAWGRAGSSGYQVKRKRGHQTDVCAGIWGFGMIVSPVV